MVGYLRVSDHVGFFCFSCEARSPRPQGPQRMDDSSSTMAQQITAAAKAIELPTTGHVPNAVTVVLSDHTLVITVHGSLSPAERAWPQVRSEPVRFRSFTNDCSQTPPARCDRRSSESPEWTRAKRQPNWRRTRARC